MARNPHKLTVVSRHADGSTCTHKLTPSGKARDPESGCTGRHDYEATCLCGWNTTGGTKTEIAYSHSLHARSASGEATHA